MNLLLRKVYREGNVLWGITYDDTYLYKIDIKSGFLEQMVLLLPDPYEKNAFTKIIPYENKFIFVPGMTDRIAIMERSDFSIKYIRIPLKKPMLGMYHMKFFSGIVYNDCLYLFGFAYPGILKYDLNNGDFIIIDDWLNEARSCKAYNDEIDGCFADYPIVEKNKVYFSFMNLNAVLSFNLDTDVSEIHIVGDDKLRYGITMRGVNNDFWLFPRDAGTMGIVRWSRLTSKFDQYAEYPQSFTRDKYVFNQMEKIDNEIFAFSHGNGKNLKINILTGKMETFEPVYDTETTWGKYIYTELQEDNIFICGWGCHILWNYQNGCRKITPWTYESALFERLERRCFQTAFRNAINRTGYAVESDEMPLEGFIRYITSEEEK